LRTHKRFVQKNSSIFVRYTWKSKITNLKQIQISKSKFENWKLEIENFSQIPSPLNSGPLLITHYSKPREKGARQAEYHPIKDIFSLVSPMPHWAEFSGQHPSRPIKDKKIIVRYFSNPSSLNYDPLLKTQVKGDETATRSSN